MLAAFMRHRRWQHGQDFKTAVAWQLCVIANPITSASLFSPGSPVRSSARPPPSHRGHLLQGKSLPRAPWWCPRRTCSRPWAPLPLPRKMNLQTEEQQGLARQRTASVTSGRKGCEDLCLGIQESGRKIWRSVGSKLKGAPAARPQRDHLQNRPFFVKM